MKHYELVSHTADVRLKLEASTLEELFEVALLGMAELIKPEACSKTCDIKNEINLSSIDPTALLVDFLSDVLTLTQTDKVIYCKIEFEKLTETEIKATIFGMTVDSFDEDVKAVTYHEAEVKKNEKGNYTTVIVFDI